MRRLTTCRASRRAPSMSSVSMDASSTMTVPKPVGGVEAFDFAVDAGEVARLANIPRHRGMGHFDEAGGSRPEVKREYRAVSREGAIKSHPLLAGIPKVKIAGGPALAQLGINAAAGQVVHLRRKNRRSEEH